MSFEKTSPGTTAASCSPPKPLPEYVSDELEYLQPSQVDEAARLLADCFLDDSNPSPQYSWIFEELLLTEEEEERAPRAAGNHKEDPRIGSKRRSRQRDALRWIFRKNLEIELEHDAAQNRTTACRCSFRRKPNQPPEMVCFFILKDVQSPTTNNSGSTDKKDGESGDGTKISTWTMLRNGILWFPILFGWRVFYRLLVVKNYFDTATLELLSSNHVVRSCRALERVVVHPSLQGKGVGTFFLRKAFFGEGTDDGSAGNGNSGGGSVILHTQEERNVAFYSRLGFVVVKKDRPFSGGTNWAMVMTSS